MVAVSGISLSGMSDGAKAESAAAFSLATPSRKSRVHVFSAEGWEVEVRQGLDWVIARSRNALSPEALLDAAIDMAHRGLDLSSVEDLNHLATLRPLDDYVAFFTETGRKVVLCYCVSDLAMEMSMQATVIRADGTVEPQPKRPVLQWSPAFRFHRLSQGGHDLYDAYRNMFLGLEALLDQLFPKQKSEGEKAWLLRTVKEAGAKVDLQKIATAGAAYPVQDIVDRLYAVRVQLFHAKTGKSLIPHERISYLAVADAYPVLVSLWTEIVRAWLSLQRGGGAFTYQGFKMFLEGPLEGLGIFITADDTRADKSDVTLSPNGMPVFSFDQKPSVRERRPGLMELNGSAEVAKLPPGQVVGRIGGITSDGTPMMVGNVLGGLTIDGADILRIGLAVRLVNPGISKTEFL